MQFLPSTPQKLRIAKLKVPKAPELHTKAERPLACYHPRRESRFLSVREGVHMKHLVAWGFGIPGVLIVIWFLMSHH